MNNYPYYNNFYATNRNYQDMRNLQDAEDQIHRQMQDLQMRQQQNMQMQTQQQPQIQQTFQLTNPQQTLNDFDGKYAESTDEVKNTLVFKNSVFVNRDMTTMWFKDASGSVKAYTLTEVVEKDEKDLQIENLQKQLDEMKSILLSASSRQIEPISYSSNEITLPSNKNASTSQLGTNTSVNNNIVRRKNRGDGNNEQRNTKYNDEQVKAN